MKKYILVFYLSMFAIFGQVYSQNTELSPVQRISIKGVVADENNEPLPSVAVWVSDPSAPASVVRSDVTRTNGEFILSVPVDRKYILTVKILGFHTITKNITVGTEDIDLGRLNLLPDVTALTEVVVRPQLMVTADRIIFNFENHPERATSNMLDMIQMMPLIWRDPFDGKIHVASPEKRYLVLRKGRRDALFNFVGVSFDEMLQRLPAMGFTTFEIWTVVPEQYKDYDYVVNILPDPTQRLFGAVGANDVDYDARSGVLTLSQGVNGSADKVRFSGNFSFVNQYAPKTKEDISTLFFPSQTMEALQIRQNAVSRSSGETWNADLKTSIDISKKQFINIGIKGNIGDRRTVKNTDTDSLSAGIHNRMQSQYRSSSESDKWELSAAYQYDFGKRQRWFNISYLMSNTPSKSEDRLFTVYENDAGHNHGRLTSSRANNMTQRLQLDYGDEYREGKYRFSSQAGYLSTNSDRKNFIFDLPAGNENTDAYTRMEQNIQRLDGFVSFVYRPIRRLSTYATLRGDYLLNDQSTKATAGSDEQMIHQKSFLPGGGGSVTYRFNIRQPEKRKQTQTMSVPMNAIGTGSGNSSVSLSYSLIQSRPSIGMMTNYENADNPLFVRRGNPNLKVENLHSLRMDFSSWFSIEPTITYSFSNNRIVQRTFSETGEYGTRIVNSYDNSGKFRSINFSGMYFNKASGTMYEPNSFRFGFNSIMCMFGYSRTDYGDGAFSTDHFISLNTGWRLIIQKFRAQVQLMYVENISKGAYEGKNVNPFSLRIGFHNPPFSGNVKLSYTVTIGDLLNIDSRSRNAVNMPDFERMTKSSTLKIPVNVGIRISYGQFNVKPVRDARQRATVEGFSIPK